MHRKLVDRSCTFLLNTYRYHNLLCKHKKKRVTIQTCTNLGLGLVAGGTPLKVDLPEKFKVKLVTSLRPRHS